MLSKGDRVGFVGSPTSAGTKPPGMAFEHLCLGDIVSKQLSKSMCWCEKQIYWHARVIELLALCCTGNSDSTELTARRTIPFASVHNVVCDDEYYLHATFLWVAFVKFAQHVYFDTDETSSLSKEGRIDDMNMAWEVVCNIGEAMKHFADELLAGIQSLESQAFDEDDEEELEGEGAGGGRASTAGHNTGEILARQRVLVEAIFEGGLNAIEAFYRCIEPGSGEGEVGEGEGEGEGAGGLGGRGRRAALEATTNLTEVLHELTEPCVVDILSEPHRRSLAACCNALGIFAEIRFEIGRAHV